MADLEVEPRPPVDLIAIDDTDMTGSVDRFLQNSWAYLTGGTPAVTGFHGVPQMVDGLIGAANGAPISSVRIDDHAFPGEMTIGDRGALTTEGLADDPANQQRIDALQRLGESMTPEGVIQLGGCNVAAGEEGEALVRRAAEVSNRTTQGAVQLQSPIIPGLDGTTVTCTPSEAGVECVTEEHPWEDTMMQGLEWARSWIL